MKINKRKLAVSIVSMFLLLFSIFSLLSSCDATEPPGRDGNNIPNTTTHNIVWQADTLGDFQSYLNDAWGTSQENVWAVGWINLDDWGSNIMHYDGNEWTSVDYFEANLNGIFGFSKNDIWAVGSNLEVVSFKSLIAHYDGTQWKTVYINHDLPMLSKVWGSSPQDIFAVGAKGTIMHYDGSQWSLMESGITERLRDIWGFASDDVYACGGNGDTFNSYLLHYNGNEWRNITDLSFSKAVDISSVWGAEQSQIHLDASGSGYFIGNPETGWAKTFIPSDNTALRQIDGCAVNNVFVIGAFGLVLHYNGNTWLRNEELYDKPSGDLNFIGVHVFDNSVFIVGDELNSSRALVYRGYLQ